MTRKAKKTAIDIRFEDQPKYIAAAVTRQEQGLTISINDLPDCQHKARLLHWVRNADSKICVIALQHKDGWQAYAGYPDLRDLKPTVENELTEPYFLSSTIEWSCEYVRDAEQVRMLGEVLPVETAIQLFPDWDIKSYKGV